MGSAVQQPLPLGLDSHAQIPDLSSNVIIEFLGHRPIPILWLHKLVDWDSRLLWLLSGPSIMLSFFNCISFFNCMLNFVTLSFTGHLRALKLDGASISCVGVQGLAYEITVGVTIVNAS